MAEYSKGDKMDINSQEDEVDVEGLQTFRRKEGSSTPSVPKVVVSETIDSADYYMKYGKRGKCVIINQKDFQVQTNLKERKGTNKDASSLKQCFRELDFSVDLRHNLEVHQIEELLKAVSSEDHSNSDCFVCCFLSHGKDGLLYGTNGKFPRDNLFEPFAGDKCLSLAGKPKIFFIQACRGGKCDKGVEVLIHCQAGDESDSAPIVKIPTLADFFIMDSTVSALVKVPISSHSSSDYILALGCVSYRSELEGSCFVQSLCDILKKHSKTEDLLSMMTRVNYKVAYEFESRNTKDKKIDKMKQISCVTSTLTRKVYF